MAQKKAEPPNAAAIGPEDPNPDPGLGKNRRMRERKRRKKWASIGDEVHELKNNYFSGQISGGFKSTEYLDLSSNLIKGSLPSRFRGNRLRYFNASNNRISGEIPSGFADEIPENATVDLSFNHQ
ncbi:hypothetical protein ARALYDRAFT_905055 [Arabidopsis lyrata subsp. lyrata]|uniref:Leucine-rich repeat family protein n=1 Tax=Arabidopsis lyrata subsp. lyrata TaxID=81972 RepID=D7LPM9_ARALL|nr:hypothetical protein ARALYDRAFT_905055 [Arabidopsis lyrata subsp. lyrata]